MPVAQLSCSIYVASLFLLFHLLVFSAEFCELGSNLLARTAPSRKEVHDHELFPRCVHRIEVPRTTKIEILLAEKGELWGANCFLHNLFFPQILTECKSFFELS